MKRNRVGQFLLMSILFVLIGACAKVSNPSGGPRDRTLPVVLETIPEYGSKNFKGKTITITFDEYVSLDNINDKFMVSPPVKKKPKVYVRGKNVIAQMEEDLRDSTTYTFYFQDAIKDLNEGNTIEDYQFVLSTGTVIDSLSVTGNVYNAFNLETPEKTMVLLYRELADSFVVKHLPDYISRVDQKGYFRINNVKAGTYRLYALKDADNSKNYNFPEEEFAFMNTPVEITEEKNFMPVVKDTVTVKKVIPKVKDVKGKKEPIIQDTIVPIGEYPLMLFAPLKTNHYLNSSGRPLKYQLTYTLSLPPDSMDFTLKIPGSREESYFIEKNREKDTIKVWLTDSTLYTQTQLVTIVTYPFTDTLGLLGYKEDTIKMRFLTPRPSRGTKVKKAAFTYENNIKGNILKPGQQIVFTSGTPFREPDTTKIKLYQISDSVRVKVGYSLVKDSTNSSRYFLNSDLIQDKKYLFVADSAAFGNIYNDYADSTGINFSVKKEDSYSKLTITIKNSKGSCIIQLLNSQEKIVSEATVNTDTKISFPLLDAGNYRLKVIYDQNGDGKWTTGDFNRGIQPEPVSYYPQEISLKTGWVLDMDQDWDIGKQFVKEQKLKEKRTSRK
ncbi:MAG: Ig-like domain-containing protein [Bacteroidales bacterium]|nr:Ig-like domain-containing protein [Bacteroidales bacterium]